MFKKIYLIGFLVFYFFDSGISFADASQPVITSNVTSTIAPISSPTSTLQSGAAFHTALVGIINQLQAIKPLLTEAEQAQPKNARIFLHFHAWQDSSGQWHSGLRTDLIAIQSSLINVLNRKQIGPRAIAPLKTDFVSGAQ